MNIGFYNEEAKIKPASLRGLSFFVYIFFPLLFFFVPSVGHAATLSVGPSTGAFTVGSTFTVSFYLNTEGEEVNAIDLIAQFPPDKLQLVSPSIGRSIFGIWTDQPTFDNRNGVINLQGVTPQGINVESGVIITLTFRVTGTGSAVVKILNTSQVLAHDGKGNDVLKEVDAGIYTLILPPPAGPLVVSETHPNQSVWYKTRSAIISWEPLLEASGYSYMISDSPVDIPDNISNGTDTQVLYRDLGNGTHYFHLKALRGGVWGGTTHYAINIDSEPPAKFPIKVWPGARTSENQLVTEFFTTDVHSGINHYELKLVPLSGRAVETERETGDGQEFFIEVTSPYVLPELTLGSYDAIIRVYDNAGNYQEAVQRIDIVTSLFKPILKEGLEVLGILIIPWFIVFTFGFVLILLIGMAAWYLERLHKRIHMRRTAGKLPKRLGAELEELKKYREKYGKMLVLALMISGIFVFSTAPVFAERVKVLAPPLVTTLSENISNNEIFYVGGKTDAADVSVIIYLQNLQSGETFSNTVESDAHRDWFYSHEDFLPSGDYVLWAQAAIGEESSPPSPQISFTVRQTAIQFGASRISYETLYLLTSIFLLLITLILTLYGVYHGYHARRAYRLLQTEIREAEESVRRGFAVLRRDIEAELSAHRKNHKGREPNDEEKKHEAQLLKDLEWAEGYIGKEVWDVAQIGQNG